MSLGSNIQVRLAPPVCMLYLTFRFTGPACAFKGEAYGLRDTTCFHTTLTVKLWLIVVNGMIRFPNHIAHRAAVHVSRHSYNDFL